MWITALVEMPVVGWRAWWGAMSIFVLYLYLSCSFGGKETGALCWLAAGWHTSRTSDRLDKTCEYIMDCLSMKQQTGCRNHVQLFVYFQEAFQVWEDYCKVLC